jgi:Pup amidohydrolase
MDAPQILFGLETEFGISRDVADGREIDVVAESIALVRAAKVPGVRLRWDYGCEDPHADTRGFRVSELRQDHDEAGYFEQDSQRPMGFTEIKSDLVLTNGARFYNDHAHPEYCTPECSTLDELVAHDVAGQRIAMACAEHLSAEGAEPVRLYKNNTDFRGHSYGCHENYLLPRSLPWETLAAAMQAFLVTRQIFAGAGKFAIEDEDEFVASGFQISQRSDFFSELQSVDTMQRRPLINTRDEPHANPRLWRRFHVILGDANLSPFATRLKVGSTALVLDALVRNPSLAQSLPVLADPLAALRAISRDRSWRWEVGLAGGGTTTALEIQRAYLEAARTTADLSGADRLRLVRDWTEVLGDLERDPLNCRDRLDWVAKFALIERFREQEGVGPDDPWLQSLDLAYALLDAGDGLYLGLEAGGSMREVPDEEAVRAAISGPPATTRAAIRGGCVARFADAIVSAQWDHVTLRTADDDWRISLTDLFAPRQIAAWREALNRAGSPDEFVREIGALLDASDVPSPSAP